jgi:hypothetical protein
MIDLAVAAIEPEKPSFKPVVPGQSSKVTVKHASYCTFETPRYFDTARDHLQSSYPLTQELAEATMGSSRTTPAEEAVGADDLLSKCHKLLAEYLF